jgi:hypothetical protein
LTKTKLAGAVAWENRPHSGMAFQFK